MKRLKSFLAIAFLLIFLYPNFMKAKNIIIPANDSIELKNGFTNAKNGDTLFVTPGVYKGNFNFLGKAIVVKSIAGPESTFLDGNYSGTVVTFDHGEDTTSVLQGFTINHGTGTTWQREIYGGGVFVKKSSCKILDCIFEENSVGTVKNQSYGGGIGAYSPEFIIVEGCIFRNNKAGGGGGAYIMNASCRFSWNIVENNLAFGGKTEGGGQGPYGGHGGGCGINGYAANQYLWIFKNIIRNNKCEGVLNSYPHSAGGGCSFGGYKIFFHDNWIEGNIAQWGAGINIGGDYSDSIFVHNNIFLNNKAEPDYVANLDQDYGEGGAIFSNIGWTSSKIFNNTFWGNQAQYGLGGCIIYYDPTEYFIYNNIFANTISPEALCISQTLPHDYNCFWKNKEGDYRGSVSYGLHDICANPRFADNKGHLRPDSPCIDKGIDLGFPFEGKAPDIGAREFGSQKIRNARIMKEWEMLKIPVDPVEDSMEKE